MSETKSSTAVKRCSRCKKVQPFDEFHVFKNGDEPKRRADCKDCYNERQRERSMYKRLGIKRPKAPPAATQINRAMWFLQGKVNEWINVDVIAEHLGCGRKSAVDSCRRLLREGLLERKDDGNPTDSWHKGRAMETYFRAVGTSKPCYKAGPTWGFAVPLERRGSW
jgi:hypothetical protein